MNTKVKRWKVDEIICRALADSELHTETWIQAHGGFDVDTEEVQKEIRFLEQLRAYRFKRFGMSRVEQVMSKMKTIELGELQNCPDQEFQYIEAHDK